MDSISSEAPRTRVAGRRGEGLGAAAARRPGGRRREGLPPAVPVVAGPGSILSRRSSMTIPSIEGAHRLDLLIEEQVCSWESSLSQSLATVNLHIMDTLGTQHFVLVERLSSFGGYFV